MCTLLLAFQVHPKYPLVLAANRDEFYERPTAAAGHWEDTPHLVAGRDLVHGGTWLGVTTTGRIAALTNFREPHAAGKNGPSRGNLVSGFLKQQVTVKDYLAGLAKEGELYNGFNLLLGDAEALYCYSNRSAEIIRIAPGIHGVSNHLMNTPWPKVVRGKQALAQVLAADEVSTEALFAILSDPSRAPDEQLPDTGVGLDMERLLSSIFIKSERYGTRSSTLLLVDKDRQATFVERSFGPGGVRDNLFSLDWSR
jgi:uncharacterized protein with NRDE domain